MKKTVIFVEEGSVDIDKLEDELGESVLLITYRQGATIPRIEQPQEGIETSIDDKAKLKDTLRAFAIEIKEAISHRAPPSHIPSAFNEISLGSAIAAVDIALENYLSKVDER